MGVASGGRRSRVERGPQGLRRRAGAPLPQLTDEDPGPRAGLAQGHAAKWSCVGTRRQQAAGGHHQVPGSAFPRGPWRQGAEALCSLPLPGTRVDPSCRPRALHKRLRVARAAHRKPRASLATRSPSQCQQPSAVPWCHHVDTEAHTPICALHLRGHNTLCTPLASLQCPTKFPRMPLVPFEHLSWCATSPTQHISYLDIRATSQLISVLEATLPWISLQFISMPKARFPKIRFRVKGTPSANDSLICAESQA